MTAVAFEEIEVEDEPDLPLEVPKEPRRSAPRPAPAKPSDLLDVRRTMARRVFGKPPTAQQLREHAEKFGIDGVAETAAEAGMGEESLTTLIASLDRINSTFRRDPKRKLLYRTPAKTSPARRARELLGIEEPEKA